MSKVTRNQRRGTSVQARQALSADAKRVRKADRGGWKARSSFMMDVFRTAKTFFEAASRSKRLENPPDTGPNSANGEIETIRRRSRWMYANDTFYRQGCNQVANNVVHYGIKPNIKDRVLREIWNTWIREADARGRLDFYGIQHLAAKVIPRDGEGVIRFRSRKPGDMRSGINFQLQCLEADYLPLDKTEILENGHSVVSGVERNLIERPVAYWLYDFHPKEWNGRANGSLLPRRVIAEDVVHIYMPDRFSDTRGYPWGASAMNTVERLRTYDDAELERKIGQSSHGGFYKKPRLAGDEDSVFDEDDEGAEIFQAMEPGEWLQVPEGWDIEFAQPSQTDANYGLFRREGLSGLSVALGLAVEMVTLNFEKLNDRLYRAVMIEVQRHIESLQYHMMVQQRCDPVWRRLVAEAYANGLWKPEKGKSIEDYYDIEWMMPKREHIHQLQAIQAVKEEILAGLKSRKRAANELGEDIEDIDQENKDDMVRATELRLSYTVYPERDSLAQYGVAVRAGAITPQVEDETAFRSEMGLPTTSQAVKDAWAAQHGFRQPITLASEMGSHVNLPGDDLGGDGDAGMEAEAA